MERAQVTFIILFLTALLFLIAFFFWLILVTQRYRANRLYQEKEAMQLSFDRQQLESLREIQENIFAEISRELHDNVGQTLSLAKVQLNILEHAGQIDREMIILAKEGISRAMTDLRDIAKGLDGERVQEANFEEALMREAELINRTGFCLVNIVTSGTPRQMPGHVKLNIYRNTQELLQNIIKHACAERVIIHLDYLSDSLELSIEDNGKGFDKSLVTSGSGLLNIQKRSAQIGACFSLDSSVGAGTRVKIIVPFG